MTPPHTHTRARACTQETREEEQFGGIYIDETSNQLRIEAPVGAATFIDGVDVVTELKNHSLTLKTLMANRNTADAEAASTLRTEMEAANEVLQQQVAALQSQLAAVVADLRSTTTSTTSTTTISTTTTSTTTYVPGACNGVAEPAVCGDHIKASQCDGDDSVRDTCPTMCGACTSTSTTTVTTTTATTATTTTTVTTVTTTTPAYARHCFKGAGAGIEAGHVVCMVKMKEAVTLATNQIYDNECKKAGLRGYNSNGGSSCGHIAGTGPTITSHCNMGGMWKAPFVAQDAIPLMGRAVWIAITSSGLGIEWNEAGPCKAGVTAEFCGRDQGTYRGIRHSLNPIYGSNYNVKNFRIEAGQYLACAVPAD